MNTSLDSSKCPVPSLVYLCQRVAISNADAISSLGEELRFEIVKPILEQCDAATLCRIEDANPSLRAGSGTQGIWEELCYKTYPLAAERLKESLIECWRDTYFKLRESEARRLEELAHKMRKQRTAAEDKKEERKVKFTDRLPPAASKRSGWGINPQPKTLFQKTKSEAFKLQRTMYSLRSVPPMVNGKTYRVIPPSPKPPLLPASTSSPLSSRVTVTTVRHVRPPPSSSSASSSDTSSSDRATSYPSSPAPAPGKLPPPPRTQQSTPHEAPTTAQAAPGPTTPRKKAPVKKDPASALFMPKHRAYSQRTK
ncbi:hypothetical protein CCMSSC00406_0005117 [Pleurotus cornucopiae]|uniref:Uncharacterized protein n=1 Tax=Pleurotus cornucopiae TaxID=5321 RepID=A0ACB7JA99_PLECO|nr:hypothetical protein CCMSSC00406_0005117 [Pleurotus cornucopiae]